MYHCYFSSVPAMNEELVAEMSLSLVSETKALSDMLLRSGKMNGAVDRGKVCACVCMSEVCTCCMQKSRFLCCVS